IPKSSATRNGLERLGVPVASRCRAIVTATADAGASPSLPSVTLRPSPPSQPTLLRSSSVKSLPSETFISTDSSLSLNTVLRRSLGELRCVQLLLPLQAVAATPRLTSHLSVSARACYNWVWDMIGRNGKDG
ncbi:hypothetical protein BHM03_00007247, partial [Ensete ventricosum]